MKLQTIMTPRHPKWRAFIAQLGRMEFCDPMSQRATQILEYCRGIDVYASRYWMHEHGGHCDCEILMNLDRENL